MSNLQQRTLEIWLASILQQDNFSIDNKVARIINAFNFIQQGGLQDEYSK